MLFDEASYTQEYIKKARLGSRLPADLMARYAITLPASDAEIEAQLKAVRAYWNKIYLGKSTAAQVARLCRAEDERLRAKYGTAMEKRYWWERQQATQQSAAEASIARLAEELRQNYGHLGVVTSGIVEKFAVRLGLSAPQAAKGVGRAGLRLVTGLSLPDSEPIGAFAALLKSMSECGVTSVPELVHPGSGPFKLVERYVCLADAAKRLDAAAVQVQSAEAEKRGINATENARRNALEILFKALKDGVDLHDIALYHLVVLARESIRLSTGLAAEELRKVGLERTDAAIIAVLLIEQDWFISTTPSSRIVGLSAQPPPPAAEKAPFFESIMKGALETPLKPITAIALPSEKPISGLSQEPVERLTVRRRVQIGIPTALPITQRELENDKYLASAVSNRNDLRFCLLRITPTFHESRGGFIIEAYVEVTLELQTDVVGIFPKVWSMSPQAVEEESSHSRNIKGSGGKAVGQASIGFDTSFQKHEPFITAYGIQGTGGYWKFTRTRGREIRGSHALEMVVCLPKEHNAEALIEIHGIVRKRKFGIFSARGAAGKDSCNIALPATAVEQVTLDPDKEASS